MVLWSPIFLMGHNDGDKEEFLLWIALLKPWLPRTAKDKSSTTSNPYLFPWEALQVSGVDLLIFWITESMETPNEVARPDSRLEGAKVKPITHESSLAWFCVEVTLTSKYSDPSNPHPRPSLLGPMPIGTFREMEAHPETTCPSRMLVEHPPPFVYHGDEWLLTRLNKGIISRLHLRSWTRAERGQQEPWASLDSQSLHKSLNHQVRDKSE